MSAPLQLSSLAQPAEALDAAAAKRHLRAATTRADQVITLGRSFRTAGWMAGGVGAIFGLIGMGTAAVTVYRAEPSVPVFTTILPDGRTERTLSVADAPTRFTEVTSRQYLQRALEYCESYHYDIRETWAPRCGLFLNPAQRERFVRYYEGEDGPQRRLGRRGSLDAIAPIYTPMGKGAQNTEAWIIRFTKRETGPEGGRVCVPWQVTVQFQWRPDLQMKPNDRNENPAGFQAYGWEGQADPSGRAGNC